MRCTRPPLSQAATLLPARATWMPGHHHQGGPRPRRGRASSTILEHRIVNGQPVMRLNACLVRFRSCSSRRPGWR
jgi:hypothetical protein